jgi:putative membrane protein
LNIIMESLRRCLLLFIKGVGIGCADVVPGISGGTIAFITGIYEELLSAIQAFGITALRLFRRGQFKALWEHLHGSFLLPLLLGIGLSLITTVQVVVYLLAHYPIQTWSFFGGLLLVSAFIVYQRIQQWRLQTMLISLGGTVLAYGLTRATPLHTPNTSWFIGLAGAISACAMILPGISGSFVLLLLGKYTFMLNALKDFKLDTLVAFSLGGVVGLLSFSRLIAWLLRQHHDNTLAFLAGFMLGSLNKIWPWKQLWSPLSLGTSNLKVGQNLSPLQFQAVFHQNPLVPQALLWMSLGMLLMVGIERQTRSKK